MDAQQCIPKSGRRIVLIILGLVGCLLGACESLAEVYQPTGSPADPRVPARWNYYRDYSEATGLLKQIVAAHPKYCRLESLGKSYGGREMWVMTITNQSTGDASEESAKPAFWIDGGIHANELQSVDVVLYTAWYLAEMAERNTQIERLLDERVFYLMPMMSPDSRDAHMTSPNTTHSPRGGQRPIDDDRDGKLDEDGPNDLDGDGHLTQMRVRDPHGRYKAHERYPNLMVRLSAEELRHNTAPTYTLLGAEGFDEDDDGRVNEDGPGYYDPNRDWAWQWQPAYVQRGAYRYPFSIPENRMVADYIMQHPNIAGAQSYHNTGGMLLRGPGSREERWPAEDIGVYDRLGKRGEQMLPGYRYLNTAKDLYEVWGGEVDWIYGMCGAYAFTNELNTPFNLFRSQENKNDFIGPESQRHKFDRWFLFGDGFVDWHEVDHPQYGKIEVGGQKKNWGRQPPSFMLEEECHRNMAFTLFHADEMPLVEIQEVKVEQLSGGLRQITATLLNPKVTPTRSAFDVKNGITPPDMVKLVDADGALVEPVATLTDDQFLFTTPTSHEKSPLSLGRLQGQRPTYVRWLVEGDQPLTVVLKSIKGGTATAEVPSIDQSATGDITKD